MEPIVLKKSKFGKGLFATKEIKIGEKICTLKGKKIKPSDLKKVSDKGKNVLEDVIF